MATPEELVGIAKRYKFPKLTGDWDVSATSDDPSDSGTEEFSSHASCSDGNQSSEESLATSGEVESHFTAVFGRKYLPKDRDNDFFPYLSFTKLLSSESVIGPNSEYVILYSSDGHAFILKRKYAYVSKVIHMYFNSTFPARLNVWDLNSRVPSHILQYVCFYFMYNYTYNKYGDTVAIPDFPIPYKIAYDLLMVAYMLQC